MRGEGEGQKKEEQAGEREEEKVDVLGSGEGGERQKREEVRCWGVLFPLGVIIARYMRTFPSADPAWFYLHVGCQVSSYAIGVAGWGTGMKLGSQSEGIQYSAHRYIGIFLFSFATLQVKK